MSVRVQEAAFDLGAESNAFAARCAASGAVVTFTGVVRDNAAGTMQAMEIEHYPGMTEAALTEIAEQGIARFKLEDALIIHRHGRLQPGELIMMVATAARHRKDAFEGAEFLMDYLKSRAPFWKREISADGADWVAAKDSDEEALSRW